MRTDPRLILLSPDDNVFVLRATMAAGEDITVLGRRIVISRQIGMGHKIACKAIRAGDKVIKYGASIGSATCDIAPGDHVHLHNLCSDYTATHSLDASRAEHEGEKL